ncbi:MAG: type II toxin-antitoxin system ParD family antitoxin [Burkholderiales bacterium]|nr:type II toxin-antitoxin system ParD family antitoxin [Phycisphaerae bacterium]
MNVTLNNPFEQFVKSLVATGRYESEQEVVEAGIASLVLQNLRADGEEIDDPTAAAIERSEEQIASGNTRSLDETIRELRLKHFQR